MKTCRAMEEIADQFIKWPTIEECAELASRYRLADTIGMALYNNNFICSYFYDILFSSCPQCV